VQPINKINVYERKIWKSKKKSKSICFYNSPVLQPINEISMRSNSARPLVRYWSESEPTVSAVTQTQNLIFLKCLWLRVLGWGGCVMTHGNFVTLLQHHRCVEFNVVYDMRHTTWGYTELNPYSDTDIDINGCSDGAPHTHTHRSVILRNQTSLGRNCQNQRLSRTSPLIGSLACRPHLLTLDLSRTVGTTFICVMLLHVCSSVRWAIVGNVKQGPNDNTAVKYK
jgi:hypothetical protein